MKKIILTAVITGLLSANAYAGQLQLDVGTDYNGDGDSLTDAPINQFGFTGTLSTSFYEIDAQGNLTGVVTDTNKRTSMDALGFNVLNQTTLSGAAADYLTSVAGIQPYQYTDVPTQSQIDALNPLGAFNDTENFNNVSAGGWGLTFEYEITGTLDFVNETTNYNQGSFEAYVYDTATVSAAVAGGATLEDAINANKDQVLRLDVTSSFNNAGGLFVFGDINFDFNDDGIDNDASALAQDFLIDIDTGLTYYDLWSAGTGTELTFRLDTNVDPVIPQNSELVATADGTKVYRQATLDGSVVFNVPEPSSIALIGLSLLGFGAVSRKKKA